MAKLNSSRWGVVALAVLMLLVTMVNTSINGQKSSIYYAVWTFVGWYGFKGNLEQIKSLMKVLIVLNVLVLLWVALLFDNEGTNLVIKDATKESLAIGVLVMLVPKVFLYLWCKDKISEQQSGFELTNTKEVIANKVEAREQSDNNEPFLNAMSEFETEKRDKALYARLFAENDGKEELIKAKYIKIKAEAQINLSPPTQQKVAVQSPKISAKSNGTSYENSGGTAFQQLLNELGVPKWFETLLLIISFVFMFYLLFNITGFFR